MRPVPVEKGNCQMSQVVEATAVVQQGPTRQVEHQKPHKLRACLFARTMACLVACLASCLDASPAACQEAVEKLLHKAFPRGLCLEAFPVAFLEMVLMRLAGPKGKREGTLVAATPSHQDPQLPHGHKCGPWLQMAESSTRGLVADLLLLMPNMHRLLALWGQDPTTSCGLMQPVELAAQQPR